jgi:hypothetical protein
MMELLSSPQLSCKSDNHCVPLLEMLKIPEEFTGDSSRRFIVVMPLLRVFNDPTFHCRQEFFEAMQQFLEVIWALSSYTR